jgi:hypothetical protein
MNEECIKNINKIVKDKHDLEYVLIKNHKNCEDINCPYLSSIKIYACRSQKLYKNIVNEKQLNLPYTLGDKNV